MEFGGNIYSSVITSLVLMSSVVFANIVLETNATLFGTRLLPVFSLLQTNLIREPIAARTTKGHKLIV